MAARRDFLQPSTPWVESPAKVFAKLKSKAQRDKRNAGAEITSPGTRWTRAGLNEAPVFRHVGGFNATSNTPVKDPLGHTSSNSVFSPMRNRLRKRRFEPLDFNNAMSSTKIHHDSRTEPQSEGHRTSSEDSGESCFGVDHLVHPPGFSAVPPDVSDIPQEPRIPPPGSVAKKNCNILLERCPVMSPAKMFAFMKQRENRAVHRELPQARKTMRALFNGNEFNPSGDRPPPVAHNVAGGGDSVTISDAESVVPVSRCSAETAESPMDLSEDASIPAVPPQPLLFEDPLILNSPRICIPKKDKTMLMPSTFPSESVIHLKGWFLRHNQKGLYVEGIHREQNIAWNSNIIAERVSPYVVKTITGRVYILTGKINLHKMSDFPRWFLKKFQSGFPLTWKDIYEKFLSELRIKNSERRNERRGKTAEAKSVKSQMKRDFKTPITCPPNSSFSTTVSRSGRVIKPPLEYWRGGRVVLDAHMNVTVHDCYETSICNPDTAATSARPLQKYLFPEQRCDEPAPAPQRNVRAPSRRRDKVKGDSWEKPSRSPDAPVEPLSIAEKSVSRGMRSSQRRRTTERAQDTDSEPQQNAGKSSKQKAKRQTVPTSRLTPEFEDTSPEQAPCRSLRVRRRQLNREHKKRGEDSAQLQYLEESKNKGRKRGRVENNREVNKSKQISVPTNNKSSKKPKSHKGRMQVLPELDEDEEQWTEEELAKLQEAVALYPKHKANYWAKVARIVGTRSAEECHNQHTFQGAAQSPVTKAKKRPKKQLEAPKGPDTAVISAGVGTFKRKQQVRHFLETMPKENMDDVFSCSYMQNKRYEIPNTYASNLSDEQDITLRDLEPITPISKGFPEVKTPQCLHITPGMMGSHDRSNDDKYVFQLQKRMKKRQFNVHKQAPSKKGFTLTPSVKRTMSRCVNAGQDVFVVREMFPADDGALSDSGEEEDYYFSDNDCI